MRVTQATGPTTAAPADLAPQPQPAVTLNGHESPRQRTRVYERWLSGEAARAEIAADQGASASDSRAAYTARAVDSVTDELAAGGYRIFAPYRAVYSALRTITPGQGVALAALGLGLAVMLWRNWTLTVMALLGVLTLFYILDLAITAALSTRTLQRNTTIAIPDEVARMVREGFWPSYTILCPLYHEAGVAAQFVRAMSLIDYPTDRLQVLFLTEEEDEETRAALLAMDLPARFEVLTVPDGKPRTKPRACNYGLTRATGDFTVIFDAEDIPDPLQLKKAALTFAHYGQELACAQASLSFYNPYQNALTRWFTAEYALWFGLTLPALRRARSFLPLGGTSNHFRTRVLREVGGWDPFNVTEDCDLGVRLAHYHYTTVLVDSTTFEEANPNLKNWLRQRSRWIKGYMQTYLTHTRRPLRYVAEGRLGEFFWLQVIVGGRTLTQLVNPILWLMTLGYIFFHSALAAPYHTLYPPAVFYAAAFCLVFGNMFYIYMYVIGCLNRQQYTLTVWALLIPFYWALMSVAAYIALYQLITRPHYWEKTDHGLSHVSGAPGWLRLWRLDPALAWTAGVRTRVATGARGVGAALVGGPRLRALRARLTAALAASLGCGPLRELVSAISVYTGEELTRARRAARLDRQRETEVAPSLALPVSPVIDLFSTVTRLAISPRLISTTAPSIASIAIPAAPPRPARPVAVPAGDIAATENPRARRFSLALPAWLAWPRDPWLMATIVTATIASVIACVYYFVHQDVLIYNDAESHMNIARRVFDSATPGLAQLGSNWLPLPHILMWPFVWNDYLWHTGLAGTLVAAPCYVVAAAYTYLCAREITGNRAASYVGALALILNPNILYLQTTPLSEATLLAVTAATCYYFLRWARNSSPTTLLAAAFCALLGVMTRYEGWSFFAALTLMIAIVDMVKRVSLRRLTGDIVVFAAPGAAGIALWLMWDYLLTGNPRYFQNGPYSPITQQTVLRQEGLLPTYHHAGLDALVMGADLIEYFGPLIVGLGLVGLGLFLVSSWRKPVGIAAMALLAPIALYLVSLYSGQTVIYIQGVMPSDIHNSIFNVRYATSAALPVAIFLAYLIHRLQAFRIQAARWAPMALAPMMLAVTILVQTVLTTQGGVISLQDGQFGVSCIVLRPVDIFLLEHYNGGKVLIDSFNDTHDYATLGIDQGNLIYEGNNTVWRAALTYPEHFAQWVIVGPHDLISKAINVHSQRFLRHFILVAKDSHGSQIYYLRRAPPLPARAAPASLLHAHAACHTGLPSNPRPNSDQPTTSPQPQGPHASIAPPPLVALASVPWPSGVLPEEARQ